MDIAWDSKGEYRKNLEQFLRYGGAHSVAARKACEIETKLRLGMDVGSQTTDHGETRIKNCSKYDLGNGYRLVTVQQADVIVFVFIGDHDSTQRWLDRHRGLVCVVDRKTWKVEFTIPNSPQPWQVAPQTTVSLTNTPFLSQVQDIDWKETIKSTATRSFLMKFDKDGDNQELLDILEELKKEQPREAELCLIIVNYLRGGQQESAQAAINLYLGKAVETSDAEPLTGEMLRAEANQGRFVVINDLSDEEITRLHDPLRFREWMIFLHPGQKRVADEDFPGPALLTGVSGSGKTCVLVHRARRLAQFFAKDRILILTLNQSLASLIQILVADLCLGEEKGRIEVKEFYDYLSEVLGALNIEAFLRSLAEFTGTNSEVEAFLKSTPQSDRLKIFRPLTEQEQIIAFDEFLAEPGNPAKAEFDRLEIFVFSQDQTIDLRRYLFEELELVRSAFTCDTDYKGYSERNSTESTELKYKREGRSVAFQENRRQAILTILREWEKFQLRRGFLDMMGLVQAAVFAVEDQGGIPDRFRYRSVLVDEFQDLSTLDLSLLRQIPKFTENGLFLTGDFAQKISAKDLNLPAAKLGRDARTDRIIRRNYRNSKQVLLAAQALLDAYPPQLAGGEDDVAVLKPEYASKESAVPIATMADDPCHAAWQYAGEWLSGGHVPFSVCIATANASSISIESILKLKPDGIQADTLTGDYLLKPNRVVVADIAAVKGFEFSLIIICGLDDGQFPRKGIPTAEHWREASRLYVAITRGRDEVRFIYQKEQSPFLKAMAEKIQFQIWKAPPQPETVVTPVVEPALQRPPKLQTAPQDQPASIAPTEAIDSIVSDHDPLIDFLDQYRPEVLNGILVVPVPSGVTENELARTLGKNQIEVALACQRQDYFVPPNHPLPDHIILGVCDYFRCVPNIIRFSPIKHPGSLVNRKR
jgi:superfamily I DNA/RNA helicase